MPTSGRKCIARLVMTNPKTTAITMAPPSSGRYSTPTWTGLYVCNSTLAVRAVAATDAAAANSATPTPATGIELVKTERTVNSGRRALNW